MLVSATIRGTLPAAAELLDSALDVGLPHAGFPNPASAIALEPTPASLLAIAAQRVPLKGYRHFGLAHALLANLPVDEIVTTNYDELFERASRAAGCPIRILPNRPDAHANRWLLKLHGSISDPGSIVLTREDYLRYEERRPAPAGIVQALLLTRHMLFVGFGLRDDNFHRIADAVQRALGDRPARTEDRGFGAALVLIDNALQQELWEGDLRWTPLSPEGPPSQETEQQASRRLEILLDTVVAETASASYLLAEGYRDGLSPSEAALSDARVPSAA